MYSPKIASVKQSIKSSQPLVSIIIPTYQYERRIYSAYRSAADQTYKNIEIIFVDDSSTDDTMLVLNDIARKDKRVKIIHKNKNEGISAARNSGLDAAKGDYICFADVDDFYDSRFIEVMLNHCLASKASIACCSVRTMLKKGTMITPFIGTAYGVATISYEEEIAKEKKLKSLFNDRDIFVFEPKSLFAVDESFVPVMSDNFYTVVQEIWGKLYSRETVQGIRFMSGADFFEDCLFLVKVFAKSPLVLVDCTYAGYNKFEHDDSAGHRGDADEAYQKEQERCIKILLNEIERLYS